MPAKKKKEQYDRSLEDEEGTVVQVHVTMQKNHCHRICNLTINN